MCFGHRFSFVLALLVPATSFADSLDMMASALQRSQSCEVSMSVKSGNQAAKRIRLVLARPNSLFVDSGPVQFRSNGTVLESIDKESNQSVKRPYDWSAMHDRLLSEDGLFIWSLFFQPDALSGYQASSQEGVPMGGAVYDRMLLTKGSKSYSVLFNPKTRLPSEIHVVDDSSPAITKILVSSVALGAKIDKALFGEGKDAGAAVSEITAAPAIVLPYKDLPSEYAVPIGSTVRFSIDLSGFKDIHVNPVTVTLVADGAIHFQDKTKAPVFQAELKCPKAGKVKVSIKGTQGGKSESFGEREITVASELPVAYRGAKARNDGSVEVAGDWSKLGQGLLDLQVNGRPVAASVEGDLLVLKGDYLIPGEVGIRGRFTRQVDGASFSLAEGRVSLAPLAQLQIAGAQEPVVVNRGSLSGTLKGALVLPSGTKAEKATAWINGYAIREVGSDASIRLEDLFDGSNEVVLEVQTPAGKLWTNPRVLQAQLAVDVQRMRVSEFMFSRMATPLRKGLYVMLHTVAGIDVPLEAMVAMGLPAGSYADAAAGAHKEMRPGEFPKLPVTADPAFNEKAGQFASSAARVAEGLVGVLQYVSRGIGENGAIASSSPATLAKTLYGMQQSILAADVAMEGVARDLEATEAFMKAFPDKGGSSVASEVRKAKTVEIEAIHTFDMRYLQHVIEIIPLVNGTAAGLAQHKEKLPKYLTGPYTQQLQEALALLIDCLKLRDRMIAVAKEIEVLEVALVRATSKEERKATADKISKLRKEMEEKRRVVRKQEAQAWITIEAAGRKTRVQTSGLSVVAPPILLPE